MVRNVSLIILYDKENKILLQKRTIDAPILPGFWSFFGGEIEKDESPLDGVFRETFEELNYKLKNPKLVLTKEYKNEKYNGTRYYYIEECTNKDLLTLQEGESMDWFTLSEAKELKTNDWNRMIFEELKKFINQ